jgi:hypothetical protein
MRLLNSFKHAGTHSGHTQINMISYIEHFPELDDFKILLLAIMIRVITACYGS